MSELMLPARGTVARLLAPRDASAVLAKFGAALVPFLRPDSGAGERRRSVIEQTSVAQILLPKRKPGTLQSRCKRYDRGLPRARGNPSTGGSQR